MRITCDRVACEMHAWWVEDARDREETVGRWSCRVVYLASKKKKKKEDKKKKKKMRRKRRLGREEAEGEGEERKQKIYPQVRLRVTRDTYSQLGII
jgi:hypothetical protein